VLWWQKKNSHKNTKTRKPTKTIFVGPFGAISCRRALVAKKKSHKNTKTQKLTKAFFVGTFGAISCRRALVAKKE
jgi:hypothetical protein